MKAVALSEAKDRLSALVDEAEQTHEIIEITRHGHTAAVLMSPDDLESLKETVFWLSQPFDVRQAIEQAQKDLAQGRTMASDEVRARYGVPLT